MSRNRMKNSQSMHWMGVVKWVLIFLLLAGLGLCYMVCKNQNMHLAEETHRMQNQLDGIKARNAELEADLQGMKSLKLLERKLAFMHSTLVPWGDARAAWVRLDQNTRARLARIGTPATTTINFNSPVVASSNAATQQSGH
jgi:hypothetical protein